MAFVVILDSVRGTETRWVDIPDINAYDGVYRVDAESIEFTLRRKIKQQSCDEGKSRETFYQ